MEPHETIKKYCKALKKDVKLYKIRRNYSSQPSAFKASKGVYILACEHTFINGVSECNLKCTYGIGNQLGVLVAMQRAYLRGEAVSLNKDNTIPIRLLTRNGFKDYTA